MERRQHDQRYVRIVATRAKSVYRFAARCGVPHRCAPWCSVGDIAPRCGAARCGSVRYAATQRCGTRVACCGGAGCGERGGHRASCGAGGGLGRRAAQAGAVRCGLAKCGAMCRAGLSNARCVAALVLLRCIARRRAAEIGGGQCRWMMARGCAWCRACHCLSVFCIGAVCGALLRFGFP